MFQTKFVQKIKTHILCSVMFFRKSYHLWDNVEKPLLYVKSIYIYNQNSLISYENKKCFKTKFVQKIKTHILCSVMFFRKSYHLWDIVEKPLLYVKSIYIYNQNSLISYENKKCFKTKSVQKIKTHFMFSNVFPKIVPFVR